MSEEYILSILEKIPKKYLLKCAKQIINQSRKMDAITLTFGDCMENHAGMQKVGEMSTNGFNFEDLDRIRHFFQELGAETKLYHLNKLLSEEYQELVDDDAYLLIVKDGVNYLQEDLSDSLYDEHSALEYD